ncbi:MAG: type II toxin-antitoxin system RelE/ParE family toxin [Deltaproteobacteria bacterium]|nr:type II toxin-antitoxin system RelE/ParE family toxin [Deltaproteobacteria bacterium]
MRFFQRKFTPHARDLLKKLPPNVKAALRALTDKILENPYLGKPLQRELQGYYSIRHSHYRVIYSLQKERRLVIIEYVGLRRSVYNLFFELRSRTEIR